MVVGSQAAAIRATLPAGVEAIENPDWAHTHLADSIALGLETLPEEDRLNFTQDQILETLRCVLSKALTQTLSCRFRRRAHVHKLEPGVVCQKRQKALTNNPCRTVEGYGQTTLRR